MRYVLGATEVTKEEYLNAMTRAYEQGSCDLKSLNSWMNKDYGIKFKARNGKVIEIIEAA